MVEEDGKPYGVLSLSDLNALPKSSWDGMAQGDVELHPPPVAPDDHLRDVLDQMMESQLTAVPVENPT